MLFGLKLKNTIFILFGAGIFAFGLVHFNMQNNLAEGGFTGLTLIIYQLIGINPSYSNLVLNIPLFLIGWKYLGRTSFLYNHWNSWFIRLAMGIRKISNRNKSRE